MTEKTDRGDGEPLFVVHFKGQPAAVAITCPSCQAEARFDAAFMAYQAAPADQPTEAVIAWNGRFVVPRFPDQVVWQDPANPAVTVMPAHKDRVPGPRDSQVLGVANCPVCGLRRRHLLHWPDDAYYHCDIRGETLWGWNRAHLIAIRDFIAGDARDVRLAVMPIGDLPAHFLLAKHRAAALRAIERCLKDR